MCLACYPHGASKASHSPHLGADSRSLSPLGGDQQLLSPCHPSPVFHSPQSSPPCSLGEVCPQICLLLAGGFSETYAALCDYNSFAFREEIQWVSWSLPWVQRWQCVTWSQDACGCLVELLELGQPRSGSCCSFAWLECPLLLGGLESKCRWEHRALDRVVSQTVT